MESQYGRPPTRAERRTERAHWAKLRAGDLGELDLGDDPWAWVQAAADDADRVDVGGAQVTAVLVAFEAARWLPATLEALAALDVRPSRLIAIDNESSDGTRALLDAARDGGVVDAVYAGKRTYGFGTAVKSALRQDRSEVLQNTDAGGDEGAETDRRWLWLLHDDAAPAPDALYQLLAHVTLEPGIDVTGPKLVLPRRRQAGQQISEIGVSISSTGRRDLGLDLAEIDQGQRDHPRARLGVSTCGMLVRTSVWRDLDGFDPALPVFRDGVEFGWRAHLNDYRVVTTPAAVLTHRQVGRAGLRPDGHTGRRPGKVDRLLGMLVVAGHAPGKMLPLVWLRLVFSCLLHALVYLLGKAPGRALEEMLALGTFVTHPRRIAAVRARTAAIDPAPGTGDVVADLRPPWWSSLRHGAEGLGGAMSDRYRSVAGEADAASLDELTTDDFGVADDRPRRGWTNPAVLVTVLAVAAAAVAARSLFGSGALTSPTLLPAYDTLRGLWRAVWTAIPGAPGQISPPWLALVAVVSTLLAGQPEWFSTLCVCGVVPLAFLTAYPMARRLVNDRRLRLWTAGTYALLPVLLGGTNQGRLSLCVFAVLLPLLATAVRALVLRRVGTPEAWRGAWGAGVVLVVLVAFEPAFLAFVLAAGLAGALWLRRTPRKVGRIAIAVTLPLVVWLPWWPSLITAPGRFFVGPDAALGGAPAAPEVWQLLLGRGLGAGLPPLWVGAVVFGVIWAVAVAGLAHRPQRRAVVAAWVAALFGLALAVGLSRLVVAVPPTGASVRPWVGVYLLLAFGALVVGGGVGTDGLFGRVNTRSFSWLQPAAVLAGLAVSLVSVGAGAWWVYAGARGPVHRSTGDSLPLYVTSALQSPSRVRALAIDLTTASVRYSVVADHGLRTGDADRGATFGASTTARGDVAGLVGRLTTGAADADVAPQLRDLGIGYVWVTGADDEERVRIGNTPGLGPASGNVESTVWQLDPAATRARVVDGTSVAAVPGSPVAVPAGNGGRLLQTGEAVDPRWRGEIAGQALPATASGWQQAFVLPADGGVVSWTLPSIAHWFLIAQGLVLLVAAVLAAPGIRRPDVRDPTRSARRAATLSELT